MAFGKFTVYTILGSIPWIVGLAAAGYGLGTQWDTVVKYFLPVSLAVLVATIGVIAWWVARRLRARRLEQEAAEREAAGKP
jgi:membrane protein DedA with SNARE-associated domain